MSHPDPLHDFLEAASVPLDAGHTTGSLDVANSLLAAHADLARQSIYAAAVLGDEAAINEALAADPSACTEKGGSRNWDALTYLCFSRYLRLDRARSEAFVRSARALLDSGADPNTGWFESSHQPSPVWESAIYGAAGVAHHAGVAELLIERGADPNDDETPYHAPENYDNAALKVLVESGKLTPQSLTTILLRKTDWHDAEAIKWLLERGVDPNLTSLWGKTALHNAILSDNALPIIDAFLDFGANPALVATHPLRGWKEAPGKSAIAMAARRGRGDVLRSLDRRGIPLELDGVERLLAACAVNDRAAIHEVSSAQPELIAALKADAAQFLTEFAGNGNTDGIERLLELGLPVDSLNERGDGYFEIAPKSTALHVASWRARHGTVKMLIDRGADVNRLDGRGRSPLALAIKACVDSHWSERRSTESIAALLAAGASKRGIPLPTGYADADKLLEECQRMNEIAFHQATPILRVQSLAASLRYYVDVLGFSLDFQYEENFAGISRCPAGLFLCQGGQGHLGSWVWIGVSDAVALCNELRAKGAIIRQEPTNHPWALEIQVADPDGNVLRFGSDPLHDQPYGPWLDMNGRLWPHEA